MFPSGDKNNGFTELEGKSATLPFGALYATEANRQENGVNPLAEVIILRAKGKSSCYYIREARRTLSKTQGVF